MYLFSAIQELGSTQILIDQVKSSLNVIADVEVLVASEPYLGYDICGMQPCLRNHGYSVGYIAALPSKC